MLKFNPNEWKIAKVTPLFKKGSKRELGTYRPISVLPLVSNIFEKIIYRQLYDNLQDNSLLAMKSFAECLGYISPLPPTNNVDVSVSSLTAQ